MPSLNMGFLNYRSSWGRQSLSAGSVHNVFQVPCTAVVQLLLFTHHSSPSPTPPPASFAPLPPPCAFLLPVKFPWLSDLLFYISPHLYVHKHYCLSTGGLGSRTTC